MWRWVSREKPNWAEVVGAIFADLTEFPDQVWQSGLDVRAEPFENISTAHAILLISQGSKCTPFTPLPLK
jgi:hypothetical protein